MRKLLVLFLGLMVFGTVALFAQPEADHRPMMRGGDHDRSIIDRLKLTDQQKTELRKMRSEMEKGMVKAESAIKLARIDLGQLLSADAPDRSAVEKKIKEISDLQFQAKMVMVNHLFDINAKLTPEQQKMFRREIANRLSEAGRRRMMGPGHRGMPGHQDGMPEHGGMLEK